MRVPEWPEGTGWNVDPESWLDIGLADGESDYLFSRVAGIEELETGEAVVADGGSGQITWAPALTEPAGARSHQRSVRYLASSSVCRVCIATSLPRMNTCSTLVSSSNGSPDQTTRSASIPAAIVP